MPVKKVRQFKQVDQHEVTFAIPAIKSPRAISGFIHFVRQQGVIGLAIGFVVGADAKSVVDSLTNNVFNPLIGVVTGNVNLSSESVCVKTVSGICKSKVEYGAVISTVISFLIALFLLYLLLKALKLDKFDKAKEI